jgi:hypothetical protein
MIGQTRIFVSCSPPLSSIERRIILGNGFQRTSHNSRKISHVTDGELWVFPFKTNVAPPCGKCANEQSIVAAELLYMMSEDWIYIKFRAWS